MKAKQKKKSGVVVRVSDGALEQLEVYPGDSLREKFDNLLDETKRLRRATKTKVFHVLPSDLCESVEEARGLAVVRAVKLKKKPEEPIVVRAAV